ncbi:MAG: IS630 family transposase, partial [Nitrososphaera sp.]
GSTIAHMLGVSRQSVYRWYKIHQSGGSLKTAHRSGRPPRLSDDQLSTLSDLLMQGATAHGWQNDLWTAGRVAEVIRKHFHVEFSIENVRVILKDRMGWTVQRPVQQEKKRDAAEIQNWKEHIFPQIVRDARTRGAHIVFIDEAGFMASPTRRQTFAPRGKTPVVKVIDPHGRISAAGAITVSPTNRHLNFIYHLLPDNVNFHGDTFALFLKEIARRIRGPMTFLWDGFSIHSSEPVKKFLEQHPEILVEPLPKYAHELNPVDKAWLYVKYDRLANYPPATLGELRDCLIQELDALQKKPKVLSWCIEQAGLKTRLQFGAA